jgi:hypothetical protein
MPRLRQKDRERAVGMVQDRMTHQAVAGPFNVSRITISGLRLLDQVVYGQCHQPLLYGS